MDLTNYAQNCGQSMFSEKIKQISTSLYVQIFFDMLSEKADYKTMYSNIPVVKTL